MVDKKKLTGVELVWCDELEKPIVIERYLKHKPRAKIMEKGFSSYLLSLGCYKDIAKEEWDKP